MILLVNDDGIDHPGLRHLYRELRAQCRTPVLTVVPTQQRSGQSHAITLDRGLVVASRLDDGFFAFAVDGTPADCVKLGITVLCPQPPKLVVSGINDGPNAGRSLFYSGTVGAAMEAAVEGFASLAVHRDHGDGGFADAAAFAAGIAADMLGDGGFAGKVINLNLPPGNAEAWLPLRMAAHGAGGFRESYLPTRDGKDRVTWRLHGEWTAAGDAGDSDAHLLRAGHPTLTLLEPDLNADQSPLVRLVAAKYPGAGGVRR